MLWKCCTQYASKSGKLSSGHRLEKVSLQSDPKERQSQRTFKLPQIALILHASKVMIKILQARLQEYVNQDLPDIQAGFRKGRETRDQTANICWIMEEARGFWKNICSSLTILEPLCGTQQTERFLDMGIPDHPTCLPPYLSPEELVCRLRSTS